MRTMTLDIGALLKFWICVSLLAAGLYVVLRWNQTREDD